MIFFFTPVIQHDFLSFFNQYFYHALYIKSFRDVQTSVISPSKAKSVCSLSVFFHKQTKTIPSGEQINNKKKTTTRTQLVNPWKCIYRQKFFITTNGRNGNALVVSVSYTLSDNTTDKVRKRTTKRKRKSKWKVSKPNRLRGSLNLWSVTLTL